MRPLQYSILPPLVLYLWSERREEGGSQGFGQELPGVFRKRIQGGLRRLPRHTGIGEQPGVAARGYISLLQGADYAGIYPLDGVLQDAGGCDEARLPALSWELVGGMGGAQLRSTI